MVDSQQATQSRSNGFWVRVGATILSGIVTGFLILFLAQTVWAHEGAIIKIETKADVRHKNIMDALERIERKVDGLVAAKKR